MNATTCPKGHEDCHHVSEVIEDFMPDFVYQLYYCSECKRTYEVEYRPKPPVFLEKGSICSEI